MIDVASESHVVQTQAHPHDPLEWYLMKLLAPVEEAGSLESEAESAEAPLETSAFHLETPGAAASADPHHGAVAHRETLRSWQRTEAGPAEAPAAPGGQPPTAVAFPGQRPRAGVPQEPSTPNAQDLPNAKKSAEAPKPKRAIRSLMRPREPGAGRQKLMLALIPVLAILLLFVLKHPLSAHAKVKTADAPHSEPARPAATEVELPWQAPAPYDPAGRDPMRTTPATALAVANAGTAAQPTEPPVELALTGILYSQDKPAALVDTQVVHEGQQISGVTVEKIEPNSVQFEKDGRRWKQAIKK